MKKVILTLELQATPEYCDTQIVTLGKMLESGEFKSKFTEGIEDKLQVLNAKLEILNTENNE